MPSKEAAIQIGLDEQQTELMYTMLEKETMNLEELLDASEIMLETPLMNRLKC